AQRGALEYRRESDLLVLHSHREIRAFEALGDRLGVVVPLALATLPYARTGSRVATGSRSVTGSRVRGRAMDAVGTASTMSEPLGGTAVAGTALAEREPRRGTDLVFAAQALVPAERHEREALADTLRRAAAARPNRRVVVKLRSRPGEAETHL